MLNVSLECGANCGLGVERVQAHGLIPTILEIHKVALGVVVLCVDLACIRCHGASFKL